MILRGIDEAWAKLDPALAKSQGFGFIIGYVSQDETKNLTRDDVARIHAAGLAVTFVMEYNPNAALGGYSSGVSDGQVALAHFRTIGVPANIAAYSAGTDFDVQPGQMAVCKEFEQGFADTVHSGGFRHGAYTGYPFGLYLTQRNYDGFLWQTYAWSNGAWLANAALRQTSNGVHIAGVDLDLDESEIVDFGQWNPTEVSVYTFKLTGDPTPDAIYAGTPGGGWYWVKTTDMLTKLRAFVTPTDLGSIDLATAQAQFGPEMPWIEEPTE